MPDTRFIVLLNDALKAHLLSLSERERGRLREKFEFLENGIWDAGVRVKKLRGISGRVVFEARLNRGDRLLFTLGNHRGSTAIYVWGIARHDEINNRAERIVPRNAPFLDFEPLQDEERADISIDAAPPEWRTQEDVEEKVPEDYGPQRWMVLDDAEWRRLLASPDPQSFESFLFLTREQEELLRAAPPVLLSGTAGSGKTTLSVYYLLKGESSGSRRIFLTYNPLLRNMAERIYRGLVEKREQPPGATMPRFVVFRELLREITGSGEKDFPPEREVGLVEFTKIFSDHRDRRKYDAELVWEEIRSIVKGSKLPLAPARFARLAARHRAGELSTAERAELRECLLGLQDLSIAKRSEGFIARRTELGDYQGFLRAMREQNPATAEDRRRVVDEIRGLVEKSAADFASPLLSADEYMSLGRKRAPAFLYDRREIHAIAEFYQDRLARSGRWDEIDLSKAALRLMDGAQEEFSYDLVVCDEVQDLTDVQLSLLFRLAKDPRAVVLTGDPRQIINPSGFRWEEVKNKLYERGIAVPPVHRLSLNFRCVGSIVRLSNALLDLKAGLVGLSDTDTREEWKFGGRPPLLLAGLEEADVLPRIDALGAGQVILSRSEATRDRLKERLGTELVFTIAEAKGLEFDTVFLWEFCADPGAAAVWNAIRAGGAVERERIPHVRHELALLYVAVTRARNGLILYDGRTPSPIWEIDAISSHVFRTSDKERLSELWGSVSSPAEWDAQGEYFLAHEHYAAARECFRNAANDRKTALASAFLLLKEGDAAAAAGLFELGGDQRRAAECCERSGGWRRALDLWKALGEQRREAVCAAHLREHDGEFEGAAREWESLGEPEAARRCWEKAGAWDRVGRALAQAGELARAAPLLEKARLFPEAAACLAKIGRDEQAADLYVRAGEMKLAAALYRKCGSDEKLLRCYRRMNDHAAIGAHYEARGDTGRAIEAYAQHVKDSERGREELLASVPEVKSRRSALKAAIRYAALGMSAKAAPLLLRAGDRERAAVELEKAGDFEGLAQCYADMGQHLNAARALERSDRDGLEVVQRIQGFLYKHLSAAGAKDRKVVDALFAEAGRLKAEGRLTGALARYRLLQDEENVRQIYLRLGRHEEAIRYFLSARNTDGAQSYVDSPECVVSTAFVEALLSEGWMRQSLEDGDVGLRRATLLVLEKSLRGAEPSLARGLTERVLAALFGRWFPDDLLPGSVYPLLLRYRVSNTIISVLRYNLQFGPSPESAFSRFVRDVTRVARETGDPDLLACAAYADDRDAFEQRAAALALTDANVAVLATSRSRYREAVAHLMAAGRINDAEFFCRAQHDMGLAGRYAEERGDLKQAVRSYTDARDFEAALRCALAAKDGAATARVYEKLGRIPEAMRAWEGLGRSRDVARLRKKYPLARVTLPLHAP